MKIGERYEEVITLKRELVEGYADLTGDKNPLHLDDAEARKAGFDRAIVHGMCAASFFSYVLGAKFPGFGTIYLGQSLKFIAPIYVGETVTYHFEVKAKKLEKPIYTIETFVIGQDGNIRISGEAFVKVPS
jgi:acyl dehydratase